MRVNLGHGLQAIDPSLGGLLYLRYLTGLMQCRMVSGACRYLSRACAAIDRPGCSKADERRALLRVIESGKGDPASVTTPL